MTQAELEAALQVAFDQCAAAACPLTEQQRLILLQCLTGHPVAGAIAFSPESESLAPDSNPLDDLTPEQRHALLQFIQAQDGPERPWKIQLLNDWLHNEDSGEVQFIREQYGPQWLNRIKPSHIAQYQTAENLEPLTLKVGDRIEVCNSLWEWVQDEGPCTREWFSCTVVAVQVLGGQGNHLNCTVRFDNGAEYEMQGMYEWNRYHWRWPED